MSGSLFGAPGGSKVGSSKVSDDGSSAKIHGAKVRAIVVKAYSLPSMLRSKNYKPVQK